MDRLQLTFLLLVIAQAAHSTEEYVGRLYDVFPPARLVSGLVSSDLRQGFLLANIAIVLLGFVCFAWLMRDRTRAIPVVWVWAVVELLNGLGHPLWTIIWRSYVPGVATAPILLVLAAYLGRLLMRDADARRA